MACAASMSMYKLISRKNEKCLPGDKDDGVGRIAYHHIDFLWQVSVPPFCHFDGLINSEAEADVQEYISTIMAAVKTWSRFMFAPVDAIFIRCHSLRPYSERKTLNTRNIIRFVIDVAPNGGGRKEKVSSRCVALLICFLRLVYFWAFLLP